jgi:enamine deaminase RidA (YjgF/YER057c/UK114 family)
MSTPIFDFSRRDIDLAIGVLIGLRRCSERQAFNEIAAVVAQTGIGLGSICRALVALASGTTPSFNHRSEVVGAWGDLIGARSDTHEPAV